MQSQNSIDEEKVWEAISSMMGKVLSSSAARVNQFEKDVRQGSALISDIGKEKESLRRKTEETTSSMQAMIEYETNVLQSESEELEGLIRAVRALEEEVEKETKLAAEIVAKQREIEQSILTYEAEAAEEVGAIDEIEMKKFEQLKKIRREFSSYEQLTNIKWDYSQLNALAGEVWLPKKLIHRRFLIEMDLSKFEIAERIWDVMEG